MSEAFISAGGVEIRLQTDEEVGVILAMSYELWQKVYDQLLLKEPLKERPRAGSGTGFLAERADDTMLNPLPMREEP